jgi:hypothetical protein
MFHIGYKLFGIIIEEGNGNDHGKRTCASSCCHSGLLLLHLLQLLLLRLSGAHSAAPIAALAKEPSHILAGYARQRGVYSPPEIPVGLPEIALQQLAQFCEAQLNGVEVGAVPREVYQNNVPRIAVFFHHSRVVEGAVVEYENRIWPWYGMVWYGMEWCQCGMVWYGMVWYGTV